MTDAIDDGDTLVATIDQMGDQSVRWLLVAGLQLQGRPLEGGCWDNGGQQRRRRRHNDGWFRRSQSGDGLDTQPGDVDVRGPAVVEVDIPRREVVHDVLAGDRREVVAPGLGLTLIGGDDDDLAAQLPLHRRQQKGAK
ncbi:MAG TPA: hypothetical protein EYQ31_14780, partial [Candidatus Handelsmanbacteria bacterium]|nr:hypothetical protein [Candidatus Handelsmanbacteria bacterium]